jgi:hypothetical protein
MAAAALTAAPIGRHCLSAAAATLLPAEVSAAERDPLSGPRGPRHLEPPAQAALDAALQEAVPKGKASVPSSMHSHGRALISRIPTQPLAVFTSHCTHVSGYHGLGFVQKIM